MKRKITFQDALYNDVALFTAIISGVLLRSYQREAAYAIVKGAILGNGGDYAVIFARQSGKNEIQARLEAYLLMLFQTEGGEIVKISPTFDPQSQNSIRRLEIALSRGGLRGLWRKAGKGRIAIGNAGITFLSGDTSSNIVGATASILLEVDEAQSVDVLKYDRDILPMAASTNAPRAMFGTSWDDATLLARQWRRCSEAERTTAFHCAFMAAADRVAAEVPAYAEFVDEQVNQFGRNHPSIRTQLYCEELTDETGMFTPERLNRMMGTHAPESEPVRDCCYVMLVDMAGAEEIQREKKMTVGYDRRAATAVTICKVIQPLGDQLKNGPFWQVAARAFFRNVNTADQIDALSAMINKWGVYRVVIDATGLGMGVADVLKKQFGSTIIPFTFTAQSKSDLAWQFTTLVENGRWQDYTAAPDSSVGTIPFRKDGIPEKCFDPMTLQRLFFRQLAGCKMDATHAGSQQVTWGVPDITRDPLTGGLLHDDFVMSAALAVVVDRDIPVSRQMSDDEWLKWNDPDSPERQQLVKDRGLDFENYARSLQGAPFLTQEQFDSGEFKSYYFTRDYYRRIEEERRAVKRYKKQVTGEK